MNPLYKFVLDEETYKISVQEITDYEDGKWTDRNKYWRYKKSGSYMYCYAKDLDKFKNFHVYSFNPDINHAKDIMIEAISQRLIKAQTEVEKWAKAFKEIHIEEK